MKGEQYYQLQRKQEDTEREHFLQSHESIEENNGQRGSVHLQKPTPRKVVGFNLGIHFALVVAYTVCSILFIRHYSSRCSHQVALKNLVFDRSVTVFRNLSGTPYAGPPSPELDSAWDELLSPMHMRVTGEELREANQESVALPEKGGFLGWMGVFHELHCIRMLREWNYKSYYHVGITSEEEQHLISHIDHCFEFLRQSSVCRADASLTTFLWSPEKARPMFNASESVHTCVDWEVLMKSAANRVVDEAEILRLQNPFLTGD